MFPLKIHGAVLEAAGRERPYARTSPIVISELDLDRPGASEILVKIEAAGICHSDLSVVDGVRTRPLPMLLGHEAAGIVQEVGRDVTSISVGQRVVTTFLPRCGICVNCRTNGKLPCIPGTAANASGELFAGGSRLIRDGVRIHHHMGVSAFASYAVVDQSSVVAVGEDVPPAVAAALGCAVLTGGGAVLNAGKPEADEEIMIVGLGGVGMAAVLTALSIGHRVIAVDANPEKLTRALEFGASAVYLPEELAASGLKAPLVVECAGSTRAFETAFAATGVGGRTVTVGLPSPSAMSAISPLTITSEARTIIGSYLGSAVPSRDIPKYEQLWRSGKLPVENLISSRVKLEDINSAMDTLADGDAIRQVILFD